MTGERRCAVCGYSYHPAATREVNWSFEESRWICGPCFFRPQLEPEHLDETDQARVMALQDEEADREDVLTDATALGYPPSRHGESPPRWR